MSSTVVRADARNLPLAAASVDLIVTSPPYFALRSYKDGGEHYDGQVGSEPTPEGFLAALWDCTAEWMRVLKPSGSLWVNLGDKYGGRASGPQGVSGDRATRTQAATYGRGVAIGRDKSLLGLPWRYAIGCTDRLGLILRAEVVWSKPNGLPEPVKDRVRRSHEQWFHFTLEPSYYSDTDAVREPIAAAGLARRAYAYNVSDSQNAGNNPVLNGAGMRPANDLGKIPGSVWTIPTQPLKVPAEIGVGHFAAFPMEWPRRIIGAWSPPGGVVLDPFGGTGTTALVADVLGRTGISIDLSHDYGRVARWRTTDAQQRQKVRDKQDAARPQQLTLDDERPAA